MVKIPRQQGDGDCLCGFYAIINGLRLALQPVGELTRDEEGELWRALIRYADRKWRFASLFLGGTTPLQLAGLARHGAEVVAKLTGKEVIFRHLSKAVVHANDGNLGAVIAHLLGNGHGAIIAGIDADDFSHWSIIRSMTAKSLWLLDSDGYHCVRLRSCATAMRPRPKQHPRYWIKIYGTFTIQAAGGSEASSLSPRSRPASARTHGVEVHGQKPRHRGLPPCLIPQ